MDEAIREFFKASHRGMSTDQALAHAVHKTKVNRNLLVQELMDKWLEVDQGDR